MDLKFAALVETLAPKLERLLAMHPLANGALHKHMPQSGIYLFTEAGRHLYVGRSNVRRARYGRHCRPGATERQAAFAFQLARGSHRSHSGILSRGRRKPRRIDARSDLRRRIHGRQGAYSGNGIPLRRKADQNCQALLEIYCAVVLQTPYNGFGTH